MEQEVAHLLSERGTPGLAHGDDVAALCLQVVDQEPHLRRLPRSVDPFEGDEHDAVPRISPVRAIVTGGAGFIGSHLVDGLLARGDEVVVLDDLSSGRRENVGAAARLVQADVRDAEAVSGVFAESKPEICFHLAAQADVRVSVERPGVDADVNVGGTINVLEAARSHDAQVVLASTGGAIYGECDGPADEDAPRRPLAPYGTSKLAAEEYLATWNRLYGTSHVSLRYGNVYGPRQDPHGEAGVVAIFLGRLAHGEDLRVFGDGRQTRDYIFARDVVEATLAAGGHPGGIFNVGTGIETSVLDLVAACGRVAGVEAAPVFDPPRLGEVARSVLDPDRTERELGFRATTPIDEGLEATWKFIRKGEGEATPGAN
jgi:UDP-glucose 4-epimerase